MRITFFQSTVNRTVRYSNEDFFTKIRRSVQIAINASTYIYDVRPILDTSGFCTLFYFMILNYYN